MGTIQICETCWCRQNSQLAGQILFCPGISAGHFQKLFQALWVLKFRVLKLKSALFNNKSTLISSKMIYPESEL